MVIGALISSFCAFVLPKGTKKDLNSQVAALARRVLLRTYVRSHPGQVPYQRGRASHAPVSLSQHHSLSVADSPLAADAF